MIPKIKYKEHSGYNNIEGVFWRKFNKNHNPYGYKRKDIIKIIKDNTHDPFYFMGLLITLIDSVDELYGLNMSVIEREERNKIYTLLYEINSLWLRNEDFCSMNIGDLSYEAWKNRLR